MTSKRANVATEGLERVDGRYIARGCLTPRAPRLDVAFMSSAHEEAVGSATDFQRDEETGEITMEIKLLDKWEPFRKSMIFSCYCGDIVAKPDVDGVLIVESASILLISVILNTANPGAFVDAIPKSTD